MNGLARVLTLYHATDHRIEAIDFVRMRQLSASLVRGGERAVKSMLGLWACPAPLPEAGENIYAFDVDTGARVERMRIGDLIQLNSSLQVHLDVDDQIDLFWSFIQSLADDVDVLVIEDASPVVGEVVVLNQAAIVNFRRHEMNPGQKYEKPFVADLPLLNARSQSDFSHLLARIPVKSMIFDSPRA